MKHDVVIARAKVKIKRVVKMTTKSEFLSHTHAHIYKKIDNKLMLWVPIYAFRPILK